MKKVSIISFIILILSTSCKKVATLDSEKESYSVLQKTNENTFGNNSKIALRDNPIFLDLLKTNNKLSNKILKNSLSKKINIEKLKINILDIENEGNKLSAFEISNKVADIFGIEKNEYWQIANKINDCAIKLKNIYGDSLTTKYILAEATATLAVSTANRGGTIQSTIEDDNGPCKDATAYAACAIGAAATAATASLACSFGLVVIPAYLICQAAVAIAQTSAIYICYVTYCK